MPEVSLALNSKPERLTTGTAIAVNGEMDLCFVISQCTAWKLQASFDGGNSYNDVEGSSTLMGTSGTLLVGTTYLQSLIRCRADHLKPVFSGTNPVCSVIRRYDKQAPPIGYSKTVQRTIVDPVAGTA